MSPRYDCELDFKRLVARSSSAKEGSAPAIEELCNQTEVSNPRRSAQDVKSNTSKPNAEDEASGLLRLSRKLTTADPRESSRSPALEVEPISLQTQARWQLRRLGGWNPVVRPRSRQPAASSCKSSQGRNVQVTSCVAQAITVVCCGRLKASASKAVGSSEVKGKSR